MNKLMEHIILALVLSGLTSVAIETVKVRLEKHAIKLKGNTWFIVSVLVSLAVAWGYAVYYNDLALKDAVMVYFIMVFGAQGFYDIVFEDKGDR